MFSRELLIDAIMGLLPPQGGIEGLTVFSGNQWNEGWKWNRDVLKGMPADQLERLYFQVKDYWNPPVPKKD